MALHSKVCPSPLEQRGLPAAEDKDALVGHSHLFWCRNCFIISPQVLGGDAVSESAQSHTVSHCSHQACADLCECR